jgi:hypothetical protein
MAAVLAVFSGTRQTYSLQQSVSRVQSDGQAVLALLTEQIRLAGYPEDTILFNSGVGDGSGFASSAANTFSEAGSSDTGLEIQFVAPYDDFRDCAGDAYSDGDIVALRIELNDGDLTCQGKGSPEILLEQVSAIDADIPLFTYGERVDDSPPDPPSVIYRDSFLDVVNVRNVAAVRLSFAHSDPDSGLTRQFVTTIPMRNQVHLVVDL